MKLRVCAKFLGWLRFAAVAIGVSDTDTLSAASVRDHEAIARRSEAVGGFDVRQYVLVAVERGTLALTVPWVTEYLRMLALDPACRKSSYVTRLLATLAAVCRCWDDDRGHPVEYLAADVEDSDATATVEAKPNGQELGSSRGLNHTRLSVVLLLGKLRAREASMHSVEMPLLTCDAVAQWRPQTLHQPEDFLQVSCLD
jgi:hypothetical protein